MSPRRQTVLPCKETDGVRQAFCVGGDVKRVVDCVRKKDFETPRRAFELNYKLDYFISKLDKPCVVLMDGMTFGGGCGLAMHAKHKISTERYEYRSRGFPFVEGRYGPCLRLV